MTTDREQKVIERIQNLMRLAKEDSGASSNERDIAARRIKALMQGIDFELSDLEDSIYYQTVGEIKSLEIPASRLPPYDWCNAIAACCAKLNYCVALGDSHGVYFYGRSVQVTATEELFNTLCLSILVEGRARFTRMFSLSGQPEAMFLSGFGLGAATAINDTVDTLISTDAGSSRALQRNEQNLAETEAWLHENIDYNTKGHDYSQEHDRNYQEGRQFGRTLDLSYKPNRPTLDDKRKN